MTDWFFNRTSDAPAPFDHSGKTAYVEACKRLGVIPASYFLRHMHDKRLDMKHHGLAAPGMKAIAMVLMVSWRHRCRTWPIWRRFNDVIGVLRHYYEVTLMRVIATVFMVSWRHRYGTSSLWRHFNEDHSHRVNGELTSLVWYMIIMTSL